MKSIVKAAEVPIGGTYRHFDVNRRAAEGPTVTCLGKGRMKDGREFNIVAGGPGGQQIPDMHSDENVVEWLNRAA